jgi:C-terminal processing protease CtpA/Prc
MRTTDPERAQIGAHAASSSAHSASSSRTSSPLRTVGLPAVTVSALSLFFCALLSDCASRKGTIGALIAEDAETGRLFVREVPPGLAAARAKLKPGDEILLIDGLDVRPMDPRQIHAALVGEVDSQVKLTLLRDEQVRRVTLKRTEAQRILPHEVRARGPEEPPNSSE